MRLEGTKTDLKVLLVLLVLSLAANGYFGRQWWAAYRARRTAFVPVAVGSKVPPLSVKTLEGNPAVIEYSSTRKPLLLYVFTPSCPWCYRNLARVRELNRQLAPTFHFVGLSLESRDLKEYVRDNGIEFAVYSSPDPGTIAAYHLGPVPQTVVVSPAGEVLQNWMGAYMNGLDRNIEKFFGISFSSR